MGAIKAEYSSIIKATGKLLIHFVYLKFSIMSFYFFLQHRAGIVIFKASTILFANDFYLGVMLEKRFINLEKEKTFLVF